MRASAFDPPEIPPAFWNRPDVCQALRSRDMGALFRLLNRHGISQIRIGTAAGISQGRVSAVIQGTRRIAGVHVFVRIADGLGMPDPARITLGLAPRSPVPTQPRAGDAQIGSLKARVPGLPTLDSEEEQEGSDPVRRRDFVGLAGASTLGAVLGDAAPDHQFVDAEPLALILAAPDVDTAPEPVSQPSDIATLTAAVNQARRQYQGCHYSELIKYLPRLLARLHTACLSLTGDAQRQAFTLSADAHHVAAGLLLKLDDRGLAYLAADRSMRAAQASEDPVTVGGSARIITHALMNGGHLAAAISTSGRYAARLDRDISAHTPESLSVYGSLLLRGAVAAAQHDQRSTAHEMLDEADDAARRLGIDGNLRWTAFGPTNAKLHRVNIAVTLGDAGTAVDVARTVDMTTIDVTERKATLLIDTARALLQWGKHEKAYIALRAAEEVAHEEVAGRPTVHRLVHDLIITAPPTVRRDAQDFAAQIGVSG